MSNITATETVETPPTPTKHSRAKDERKKKSPFKYFVKATASGVIRKKLGRGLGRKLKHVEDMVKMK
ncbi:hypothetical protein ACR2XN_28245 [Klebsiella pneumoniae]